MTVMPRDSVTTMPMMPLHRCLAPLLAITRCHHCLTKLSMLSAMLSMMSSLSCSSNDLLAAPSMALMKMKTTLMTELMMMTT
jgi:hypothetical protein